MSLLPLGSSSSCARGSANLNSSSPGPCVFRHHLFGKVPFPPALLHCLRNSWQGPCSGWASPSSPGTNFPQGRQKLHCLLPCHEKSLSWGRAFRAAKSALLFKENLMSPIKDRGRKERMTTGEILIFSLYHQVLAAWSSVFTSFSFSWKETKMCYVWQGRSCGTQMPGGGLVLWEQQHLQEVWVLLCSGGFACVVFFIFSAF